MAAQAKIGVIGMSVCIFNWQSNQLQLNNWVSQLISTVCNWQLCATGGQTKNYLGNSLRINKIELRKALKMSLKHRLFFYE